MTVRTYEFRVDGQLSERAREAFCDMDIEELASCTALVGTVIDEAHLLGIMARCRTLGLSVISAHRIPGSSAQAAHDRTGAGRPDRSSPAMTSPWDPGRGTRGR